LSAAPFPDNEAERQAALEKYQVLDTPPQVDFDHLVAMAAQILETPISLISLIDHNRQWFKAKFGIEDIAETPREHAFCAHTILSGEALVIEDATQDARFADNPFVQGAPHVRFYAGLPLTTPDGYHLGSLCVIDQKPRELNDFQRFALQTLSRQVMHLLELQHYMHQQQQALEIIQAQQGELQDLYQFNLQLLGLVSQEVLEPVTNTAMLFQMLEKDKHLSAANRETFQVFRTQFDSIREILDQILRWEKLLKQPDPNLKQQSIHLLDLIGSLTQKLRSHPQFASERLLYDVPEGLILKGHLDTLRFILQYLLLFALEAAGEHRVYLTCGLDQTQLSIKLSFKLGINDMNLMHTLNHNLSQTEQSFELGYLGVFLAQRYLPLMEGHLQGYVDSEQFCYLHITLANQLG